MSDSSPIHPKIAQRKSQVEDMRKAAETNGVRVVPFEEMNAFGKHLYKECGSFEVEIDPGEFEYRHASDQVKAWQQQYREAKSETLKAKLKKKINQNTGIPFTPETQYLSLCYLNETGEQMKHRITEQMYGKDHVIDIPEDLESAIQALMSE